MSRYRPEIIIEELDYHRNGVGGIGFYVVKFSEPSEERRMLAVLFTTSDDDTRAAKCNGACAVFNRALLAQDNITFGENSWRGDVYESSLRAAIAAYWANDFKPVTVGRWAWHQSAMETV